MIKDDIDTAAEMALPHRIRRQPLQDIVVDVDRLRRRKPGPIGGKCIIELVALARDYQPPRGPKKRH